VIDDGGNLVYQAQTAYDDESWTVGGDRNWTDMRIEVRVKFVSELSDGDGLIYLGGRWAPGDRNYYFTEFRSSGKPKVRRKTNGSSTDIVTDLEEVEAGMGTWHTLSLTLAGADVTLELDGSVLGTATDSAALGAGGIALGTRDCVAAFDDVNVTVP
jgi:pectate lyase